MVIISMLAYHLVVGSILHGPPRHDIAMDNNQFRCGVRNLYHESRGESILGQAMVMQTVLNRVRDKKHPSTICKVVYAKHQFSWTTVIPKSKQKVPQKTTQEKYVLFKLEKVAQVVVFLDSFGIDVAKGAQYYHAKSVKPYWRKSMEKVAMEGEHIFYKMKEKT